MNLRRPALLAATIATAAVPALASLTPAVAAPAAAPNACTRAVATAPSTAPGDTPIIELILNAFPEPVQCDARQVLAGDFNQVLPLLNDLTHLTPAQLSAILTKLQGLAGQLPGTSPTPQNATAGDGAGTTELIFGQPELSNLLGQIHGGKLTPQSAFQLLLSAITQLPRS